MPFYNIYNKKRKILDTTIFLFVLFLSLPVFSADIQAVLDTTDGTSGMVIQDSANVPRMRILSSGNVGINTVTPVGTLEIIKSGTIAPVVISSSPAAPGDYLSITAAGNVGIGTVGASSKLHVNVGSNENLRVRSGTDFSSINGVAFQSLNDAGNSLQQLTLRSSDLIFSVTGNVGIGTSTPQGQLVILNGNVGVGTFAPVQALDVIGTVKSNALSTGGGTFAVNGAGAITATSAITTTGGYSQSGASTNTLSGTTLFSSNVGVGTATPGTAVDVVGTVRATTFIGSGAGITGVSAVPSGGLNAIQYGDGAVTLGDESKLSFNGTNVGINTTSGIAALDVRTGNIYVGSGNVGFGTSTPQGKLAVISGNVGIGTWSPQAALQVIGTVNATSFVGDGSLVTGVLAFPDGGLNAVQYGDGLSTLGDETKFSFNGTNVGINTTNGLAALDVRGTVYATGNVGLGTIASQSALSIMSGNVGIGTWAATEALDVKGTVKSNAITTTGGYTQSGSSVNTLTGQTTLSSNVGIGTTTPQGKLAVISGNVGIGTWSPQAALQVIGAVNATSFIGDGSLVTGVLAFPDGGLNAVQYGDGLSTLGDETKFSFNGTNVGIGTTNGRAMLDVRGNVYTTGNVGLGTLASQSALSVMSGNVGIGSWAATQALDVIGTVKSDALTTAGGTFAVNGSGAITATSAITTTGGYTQSGVSVNTLTGQTTFSSNVGIGTTTPQGKLAVISGNVGIGTWSPQAALQVIGAVNATSFIGDGSLVTGVLAFPDGGLNAVQYGDGLSTLGDETKFSFNGTNVGIGTTNGRAMLDVRGNVYTTGNVGLGTLASQSALSVMSGNVGIGSWAATQALDVIGTVKSDALTTAGGTFAVNGSGAITATSAITTTGGYTQSGVSVNTLTGQTTFSSNVGIGTTTPQGKLAIISGNVGIGTWSPQAALQVIGAVNATSFIGDGSLVTGVLAFPDGGLNAVQYGDGLSTLGDETKFSFNGTNVGVGTTDGRAMLDVRGNVYTTGNVGLGTVASQSALSVMSGNVGIGTWAATQALDVIGTVKSDALTTAGGTFAVNGSGAITATSAITTTGGYTQSGTSVNTLTGQTILSSNVGIGTTTPQGKLAIISGNVGIGTWSPQAALQVIGAVNATSFIGDGSLVTGVLAFPDGGLNAVQYGDGLSTLGDETKFSFNGTNVGVGTTNGIAMLDVRGDVRTTGNIGIGTITTQSGLAVMTGNVGIGTWVPVQALEVNGTVKSNAAIVGSLSGIIKGTSGTLSVATSGTDYAPATTGNNILTGNGAGGFTNVNDAYAAATGNVGLGTSLSVNRLDVQGAVGIGSAYAGYVGAPSNGLIVQGNVGVGSAAPGAKVDVTGTVRATSFIGDGSLVTGVLAFPDGGLNAVQYGDGLSTLGDETKFSFNGTNVGIGTTNGIAMLDVRGDVRTTGNIGIGTIATQSGLAVMTGNVGIGTWAATQALEVIGAVKSDALTTAGGTFAVNASGAITATSAITTTGGYTQSGISVNTLTGQTTISNNVGIGTTTPQTALALINGNLGIGTWTAAGGRLIIAAGGNVGVGTVWPGTAVDVLGTVRATTFIGNGAGISGVSASPAGGANALQYSDGSVTVGDETKLSFNGTNVGIGTTNGVAMLDVRGNVYTTGNVGLGTVASQSALSVMSGNVGIGTWAATQALDVIGTVKSNALTTAGGTFAVDGAGAITATSAITTTGGYTQSGASVNTLTGQTILSSNVGIGTTSPQGKLAVISGNVGIGTWSPQSALQVIGTVNATSFVGDGSLVTGVLAFPDGGLGAVQYGDGLSTLGDETKFSFNGINVGIGTTNGRAMLDVRGNVYTTGNIGVGTSTAQSALSVTSGNVGIGTWTADGGNLIVNGGGNVGIGTIWPGTALDVNGVIRSTSGGVRFPDGTTQTTAAANTPPGGSSTQLQYNNGGSFNGIVNSNVTASGNVGLGTTLSTNKLDISGGVGIGTTYAGYRSAPSNGMAIEGNVGIGTWNPISTFTVRSGAAVENQLQIIDTNNAASGISFRFSNDPSYTSYWIVGKNIAGSGGLAFYYSGTRMLLTPDGNLGIGSNPLNKLDVNGSIVGGAFAGQRVAPSNGLAVSGNIGVGTNVANNVIAVVGNVGIATGNSSTYLYTAAPSGGMLVEGNVGIGSLAPGAKVDVTGTVRATSFVGDGSLVTGVLAFPDGGLNAVQYGDGLSTLGDETKFSFNGTNIGVGTTNGIAMLDVRGDVRTTGNIGIGTITTQSGLAVMTGNVGIGTWVPVQALEVNGTVKSNAAIVGSLSGIIKGTSGTLSAATAGTDYAPATTGNNILTGNGAGGFTNVNDAYAAATGNVGLGTSLSVNRLDVQGAVGIGSAYAGYVGAPSNGLIVQGNVGVGSTAPGTKVDVTGTVRATSFVGDGTNITGVLAFPDGGLGAVQYGDGLSTLGDETKFSFNGTNVGIGTTNGRAMLDVRGNVYTTGNIGVGTSTAQSALSVTSGNVGIGTWTADGGNLIVNGGGNVGIGTIWPGTALDVNGVIRSTSGGMRFPDGTTQTTAAANTPPGGSSTQMQYNSGGSFAGIVNSNVDTAGNIGLGTTLSTNKLDILGGVGIGTSYAGYVAAPSNGLIVQGNVGVGSAAPGTKVDVTGTVRATSFVGDGTNITGVLAFPDGGLGAVQYGDGLSTLGDETKFSFNGTNVGVGTTNGVAMLDVRGNVYTTGNVGLGTVASQSALSVMSGNVGIGTWAATQALDVFGTVKATAFTGDGSQLTGLTSAGGFSDNGTNVHLTTGSDNVGLGTSDASQGKLIVVGGNVGIGTTTPQSALVVTSGNVGIGTWVASNALSVRGGVGVGSAAFTTNNAASSGQLIVQTGIGIGTFQPASAFDMNLSGSFQVHNGTSYMMHGAPGGGVNFFSSSSAATGIVAVEGSVMVGGTPGGGVNPPTNGIYSTGNVGVGTFSAQTKLAVGGNVGIGTWTADGGNLIVKGGGNVGVGTSWPGTAVDVQGTVRATAFVGDGTNITGVLAFPDGGLGAVQYGDGLSTLGDETKFSFNGTNVGIGTTNGVAMLDVRGNVYTSGNVGVGTSTPQGALTVTNGNVGIGTWAPIYALDVVGDTRISGNIEINLQ